MTERPLLPGEYTVLALLALRPMHGYEMAVFVQSEGISDIWPMENSTLYTYLRNVEGWGLVSWSETRVGNRPPRKIYELTADGQEFIGTWLRRPVMRMREVRAELLLKLFFLEQLDPVARCTLLNDQIEACHAYLGQVRAHEPATAFGRLVARSKMSAAEGTLDWLTAYADEIEREPRSA
jgi:DNA-binding PadR family transcriptional regulator